MKGAIIGCGSVVQDHHVPAWQRLGREAVREWTLADPSMESRYVVQMSMGVPMEHAYRDHRALLLREKPDFAVVSTPHTLHERIVVDCLRAGVAVLVEKPMAANLAAARRMVEVSEQEGIPLAVIHNYRARPQADLVRSLLAKGVIGRPFLFRHESMGMGWQPGAPGFDVDWRAKWAIAGGGCLLDNGYHAVYAAMDYLGPVETAFARVQTVRPGVEVDDLAMVVLTHSGGGTTCVQVAWSISGESVSVNELYGESGTLRVEPGGTVALSRPDHDWERHHATADAGFQAVFQRFVEAVQGHGVPCTTGREGLECLRVVRAAYLSAERGERVSVAEYDEA